MNTFPSKIVSVRSKHLMAILMEQHIDQNLLQRCIEEAIKRENTGYQYSEKRSKIAHDLAAML